jgi:hypothetical protein
VKEKLLPGGLEPLGSTPEEMMEMLRVDIAKYAKIAKDAKSQPE